MAHVEPFAYAPYYCEENVWQLAQRPEFAKRRALVVFVTNAFRACALHAQRAAPSPGEPVVWDYHVVFVVDDGGWNVWDLDSTLPLPTSLDDYLARTFPPTTAPAALAPRFRVVDRDRFVATFTSDRSHMRNAAGGWQAPPPPWPAIQREGEPSNLSRWLDLMDSWAGDVLDLAGLRARLARAASR